MLNVVQMEVIVFVDFEPNISDHWKGRKKRKEGREGKEKSDVPLCWSLRQTRMNEIYA